MRPSRRRPSDAGPSSVEGSLGAQVGRAPSDKSDAQQVRAGERGPETGRKAGDGSGKAVGGADAARVPRQAGARPRPMIITGAALAVLAVVAVLAQLVLSSQDASRNAAQERFVSGAAVRGQLTASLLATTSSSLRAAATKLPPTRKALDRCAASSHLGYAAILSSSGSVVASSSGATPAVLRQLASRPGYIRQALSGRTWISDVQPAAAVALDARLGAPVPLGRRPARARRGSPHRRPEPFLTSFLDQGSSGRAVYVVDSRAAPDRVVEIGGPGAGQGAARAAGRRRRHLVAHDRRRLRGRRRHQRLRLAPRADAAHAALYPGITGSRSWLLWAIVALVAIVGFASLVPLRRSQVRAAQLAAAHAEVSALNAIARGEGGRAHGARRAARARARPLERRARAVRLGRRARPAGAAAQDPHVLRAARAQAEVPDEARGRRRRAWRPRPGACRT